MASQSTRKPDPGPESDEASGETGTPQDAKPLVGEYVDGTPRTYHWPDGPQTAEFGDVVVLPDGLVDDGRWQPTAKKPTRGRDNHPDEIKKTGERQAAARRKAHEETAKAAEGGERR